MKNRNLIIILVVGLVVLVGLGILIFSGKKPAPAPVVQVPTEEVVSTMKPEEIDLSLEMSPDNKKVVFEIANTEKLTSLDYELSYTSKGDVPRGAIGHIDIKQAGKTVTQDVTLGTCSDVCHYDQDVANVKLILKVVKTDGSVSQVEKSLDL
jgi:hypothetical protein